MVYTPSPHGRLTITTMIRRTSSPSSPPVIFLFLSVPTPAISLSRVTIHSMAASHPVSYSSGRSCAHPATTLTRNPQTQYRAISLLCIQSTEITFHCLRRSLPFSTSASTPHPLISLAHPTPAVLLSSHLASNIQHPSSSSCIPRFPSILCTNTHL